MNALIGDGTVSKEAMKFMKERGGKWFAYQNEDNAKAVKFRFMKCGEECLYNNPPEKLPKTVLESDVRYYLVGEVDVVQEKVTAIVKEKQAQ